MDPKEKKYNSLSDILVEEAEDFFDWELANFEETDEKTYDEEWFNAIKDLQELGFLDEND